MAKNRILIFFLFLIPPILIFSISLPTAKTFLESDWPHHIPPKGDQGMIYNSFRLALEGTVPPGVQNGWMPVGYMSLLGFYHQISHLWTRPTAETTFLFSSIFYLALLSFLTVLFMYRVARDQSPSSSSLKLAASSLGVWLSVFVFSNIFRFSFYPWSHYAAAVVGIAFVFSFYELLIRNKNLTYFWFLFFGCLTLETRRHEALALFLSCFLVLALYFVLKKQWPRWNKSWLMKGFFAVAGYFLALGFIYHFSFHMPFNDHYAQHRASLPWVDEYLKVYPRFIPFRFLQVFFDPNFLSFGAPVKSYSVFAKTFDVEDWGLPLILQLPILFYLIPLCVGFVVFGLRKRLLLKEPLSPASIVFLIGLLTFGSITCGYLATAVVGGVHLKHGFVREFVLCISLLAVGTGPSLYSFLKQKTGKSWTLVFLPVVGVLGLGLFIGQLLVPQFELLQWKSTHLTSENKILFDCQGDLCKADVEYLDLGGKAVNPPFQHTILTVRCENEMDPELGQVPGRAETQIGPHFEFQLSRCVQYNEISFYPLFTGKAGSVPPFKLRICTQQGPDCQSGPVKTASE